VLRGTLWNLWRENIPKLNLNWVLAECKSAISLLSQSEQSTDLVKANIWNSRHVHVLKLHFLTCEQEWTCIQYNTEVYYDICIWDTSQKVRLFNPLQPQFILFTTTHILHDALPILRVFYSISVQNLLLTDLHQCCLH